MTMGSDPQPTASNGTPEGSSGVATPQVVPSDMVLMKDHIALRKGLEGERDAQKESHIKIVGDLNQQVSDLTNSTSQLQAKVETLEEASKNIQSTSDELATVRGLLTTRDEEVQKLNGTLVTTFTARLKEKGLTDEKLKDKTIEQLTLMEETLSGIAPTPATPGGGYAAGGGSGGGAPAPLNQLESAKQMLAEAREKSASSATS